MGKNRNNFNNKSLRKLKKQERRAHQNSDLNWFANDAEEQIVVEDPSADSPRPTYNSDTLITIGIIIFSIYVLSFFIMPSSKKDELNFNPNPFKWVDCVIGTAIAMFLLKMAKI